jgi:hypothetical protein
MPKAGGRTQTSLISTKQKCERSLFLRSHHKPSCCRQDSLFTLLALARTTPGEQKTEDRTNAKGDANGFVRIFGHGFMRGFRAGNGFVADIADKLFALFDQRPDVVIGGFHRVSGCMCGCMSVHMVIELLVE